MGDIDLPDMLWTHFVAHSADLVLPLILGFFVILSKFVESAIVFIKRAARYLA